MTRKTQPKECNIHMRSSRLSVAALLAAACALVLAACGNGNNSNSGSSGGGASSGQLSGGADVAPSGDQQSGGTLNVVSNEGWEHLDPGQSYFQIDYLVVDAVQSPLYMFTPESPGKPVPISADGAPQISSDGKTVTVKIKKGMKFGGATTREITSADFKYAFERMFNPNVPNGYAGSYFPIVGADKSKGGPISGITTPDKYTIVFKLTKDYGATFAQALTLPGSSPVPKEIAGPMDKKNPTPYDADPTKQAFSGPYVITSYKAGRQIVLDRNPSWNKDLEGVRPAYADKIVWKAGGDPNVLARQTLNSTDLLMADGPPAPVLKQAYNSKRKQLTTSTLGMYYISMNTQYGPFKDLNLRKAMTAAMDRNAYLLARGGKLVGKVASHFIPPEVSGFQESGGEKGFGEDYLANPSGDLTVARKYMKAAGYPSGKYTGSDKVLIVGSNADPGPKEMAIVQDAAESLGFKTEVKPVPQQTMYSKFCGYVKAKITMCPTAGWIEDFPDPYSMLYVPFNGNAIVPVNNVNWAVFDDPQVNAAMDKATAVTDPSARAKAWADVNKMIVEKAPAIPAVWSSNALVKGTQVHGVLDTWNNDWNLTWSSVK